MKLKCPIKSAHNLVEVAPELFQCPLCGYGPSTSGYRPFWAISNVEIGDNGIVEGISIRFDRYHSCYVMSGVSWAIDKSGAKVHGSFIEGASAMLSDKDLPAMALPIVVMAKGKWTLPTNKPKLVERMYTTALGLKEISLSSARERRS